MGPRWTSSRRGPGGTERRTRRHRRPDGGPARHAGPAAPPGVKDHRRRAPCARRGLLSREIATEVAVDTLISAGVRRSRWRSGRASSAFSSPTPLHSRSGRAAPASPRSVRSDDDGAGSVGGAGPRDGAKHSRSSDTLLRWTAKAAGVSRRCATPTRIRSQPCRVPGALAAHLGKPLTKRPEPSRAWAGGPTNENASLTVGPAPAGRGGLLLLRARRRAFPSPWWSRPRTRRDRRSRKPGRTRSARIPPAACPTDPSASAAPSAREVGPRTVHLDRAAADGASGGFQAVSTGTSASSRASPRAPMAPAWKAMARSSARPCRAAGSPLDGPARRTRTPASSMAGDDRRLPGRRHGAALRCHHRFLHCSGTGCAQVRPWGRC